MMQVKETSFQKDFQTPSYLAAMSWIMEPKGRDSRKQIVIFKKVTTCFNFKDMFRCCQHHHQLQNF